MLTGKKFPENVTALRMSVEELLHPIFENHTLESMNDLRANLGDLSKRYCNQ